MEIIKGIFTGIFSGFCALVPVSYEGHRKMWEQLYINLTGGGCDSILPLVIQFGIIITLIYFLRNDLLLIITTLGHLFKNIIKKSDLSHKKKEINLILMIVFAMIPFVLMPLFSLLFSSMSGNLMMVALAFLISGLILYSSDNKRERRLSQKNETPLNAIGVGLFKILSVMPGFSGIGGMYYCGMLSGFTKEFALKFSYIVTLIAAICSFIKNIIVMGADVVITNNVLGYIFAFIVSLLASYYSIQLTFIAMRKKHLKYFGFYNIIIAVFIFVIWMRG